MQHESPALGTRRFSRVGAGCLVLLVFGFSAFFTSCGRLGLPSPPAHIMERTGQLQGMQRGSEIYLWWPPPSMIAKPYSKYYVDHVDIYKLMERRDQLPTVDPDEYLDSAELIKFYPREEIERQARETGRLEFIDTLDFSVGRKQVINTRIRYAVRYVNKYGEDALFSNSLEIEPNPSVAMPPIVDPEVLQAQDKVTVSWKPPTGNVDGRVPANVVGYNIYRRTIGEPKEPATAETTNGTKAKPAQSPSNKRPPEFELLNKDPWIDQSFTDIHFKYLAKYEYMVRAVSAGTSGLIESQDSTTIAVTPVDTFKPSRPDNLSIASANKVISLFWPANTEHDVAGYNVYRSDRPAAQAGDWIKLTARPSPATTYHDETATIGLRYYYRITAVDKFDNESEPSAVVSEVANP
ncbi:MAG TPA: hypothetical protein VI756_01505 [Blastocatellia bacterium]